MTAQTLDDLNTLGYGRAEVSKTHGKVAYVDVIRTDADVHQSLNQLLHNVYTVIHAVQKHRLVAEGDAGVGKHCAGLFGLLGYFIGMVEVGIYPDGMVLFKHIAQLGGYPLRTHNGRAGTQTDDLNMGDLPELGDNVLQLFVGDHQSVAAGKQNVAYLGVIPNVLQTALDLILRNGLVSLTGKAAPCAVTAVHGALVGDEEQYAVGIPVGKPGHGGIGILMQRIKLIFRRLIKLGGSGDALTPYGVIGIVGIDERKVVGGYSHAKGAEALPYAVLLLGSQLNVLLEFL